MQFECQCSVYEIQLLVRLKSPTENCTENFSHKHNASYISFFNFRPKKVSKCERKLREIKILNYLFLFAIWIFNNAQVLAQIPERSELYFFSLAVQLFGSQ